MKKIIVVFALFLIGCCPYQQVSITPLKSAKNELRQQLSKGEITECEYNDLIIGYYELYGVDGIIPKPKKRLHINVYFK